MKKYIFILAISVSLYFGIPQLTHAQLRTDSNNVTTRVGSPTVQAPDAGSLEAILSWAQRINDALEPALWDFRNKMMADICNTDNYCAHKRLGLSDSVNQLTLDAIYWCTFIVVDSFNLAGNKGLTQESHLAVVNMIRFFKSTPGYFYLDYQHEDPITILSQVKPGYAYFLVTSPSLEHRGAEHTGLVKSIQIDKYGNGSLTTVESNASVPGRTYPIVNGQVLESHYPLRGFGGIN
jgi:hypothetical protein